ncbi:MAG: hypothetical protein QM753_04920 [Thermomicrobiales bacterium]
MAERDGSFFLEPDVYLFTTFVIVRGEMTEFVAQVEVHRDGVWHPIIRYDTAHGEAHIDYINPGGRTYDKVWLGEKAPCNKLYAAITTELRTEYRTHLARWHRQRRRRA